MSDKLAIFRNTGLGTRLLRALENYAKEYVFSPDAGSDYEPSEYERMLFEDMLNGAFADPSVDSILQEAARGMKAGGMDPEGEDG